MTEQDKKIKELLKGNFDEPSPSPDFTKNIMESIVAQEVLKEQNEFKYVPLISRTGWTLICVLFLAVVCLGLTSDKGSRFSVSNYVPDWQFESPVFHSQLALFAVLSILTLLIIDRLLIRFRLS
jgi:hypothetical protein